MPVRVRVTFLVTLAVACLLAGCKHAPSGPPPGGGAIVAVTASPPVVLDGRGIEGGSGWVYDAPKGLIATAYHVLNGRPSIEVGLGPAQPADVVAAAPCEDVALLRVRDHSQLETMRLGSESELTTGEHVTAVGYPAQKTRRRQAVGGDLIAIHAPLAAAARGLTFPPLQDVVESRGHIVPGSSGGPMLDDAGRLVGMNFASDEIHTLAIGVDRLSAVLAQLRRKQSVGWIGRGFDFPSGPDAEPGVLVYGLTQSGQYAGNGVLVKAVNGVRVTNSFTSWCRAVGKLDGHSARVTYALGPGMRTVTRRVGINPSPDVPIRLGGPAAPVPPHSQPPSGVVRLDGAQSGTFTIPGTGWLYDKRRARAITAFDVVNGGGAIHTIQAGSSDRWEASVVAASPCEDVAVLRLIDSEGMRPLRFAPTDALAPGTGVSSLGFYDGGVKGSPWNVMRGRVVRSRLSLPAASRAQPAVADVLQTTPIYDDGKVGGPVVDAAGRVVGMLAYELHLGPTARPSSLVIGSDRIRRVLGLFERGIAPGWVGRSVVFKPARATNGEAGAIVNGLHHVFGSYDGGGVLVTAVDHKPVGNSIATWCRVVAPLGPRRAAITYREYPGQPEMTVVRTINAVRGR